MVRILVPVCAVAAAFIMLLGVCQTATRNAKYDRDIAFDGRSCLALDTAESIETRSLFHCSAVCSGKKCGRFFYNPVSGMCTACYTLYDSTLLLPLDPGTFAYKYHFECDSVDEGRFNTSCYVVHPTPIMSWYVAKTFCASTPNSHLVVPETYKEYSYLITWFPAKLAGEYLYVHIGYTDEVEEGTWVSVIGGQLDYTPPWGLVTGLAGPTLNCVVLDVFDAWFSGECSAEVHVICERDMIS